MEPRFLLQKKLGKALTLALLGVGCVGGHLAGGSVADAPPNIVVIIADDMGYSDLGCYGGEIHTPAIDRLAGEGLRFRQFYTSAKCETTRTALMSGLYYNRAGTGIRRGKTVGEVLKKAGYATAVSGKWHLAGNPLDRGFDDFFGILHGAAHHFKTYAGGRLYRGHERLSAEDDPGDFYSTDGFTSFAIDFMEDAVTRKQPFFVYLAPTAPHSPIQAREEDIARYRGTYLDKGWDQIRRERFERQKAMGLVDPEWVLPKRPFDIPAWKQLSLDLRAIEDARMAAFAAMVDRIDQNVARVVEHLDEWGVADNTLIMVCSDNGASPFDRTLPSHRDGSPRPGARNSQWRMGVGWSWVSNTPFRFYKQNQSNGGILAPLIARWPHAIAPERAGAVIDTPVHVIDFLPTFADLAGVDYRRHFPEEPAIDGLSLRSIFTGGAALDRKRLFFEFANEEFAVLDYPWKIVSVNRSPWRLFHMGDDRTESRDLARQQPERVQELSAAYNQWIGEIDPKRRFSGMEPDTSNYDDRELYENPRTGDRFAGPRGEPPGWHVDAIGDVSALTIRETGGEGEGDDKGGFTVTCDGARIGSTSDHFVFIRERDVEGNEILVKIDGIRGGGAHARAGVMFRRGKAADAPFILAEVNRNGHSNRPSVNLRIRERAGEAAILQKGPSVRWPVWIRVLRDGRHLSAQYSTDGRHFVELSSTQLPELPAAEEYMGGIALNAQKTSEKADFRLHDISFGSAASPSP